MNQHAMRSLYPNSDEIIISVHNFPIMVYKESFVSNDYTRCMIYLYHFVIFLFYSYNITSNCLLVLGVYLPSYTVYTRGAKVGGGVATLPEFWKGGLNPPLIFRKNCVKIIKSGPFCVKFLKVGLFYSLCIELLKCGHF